MKKKGTGRKIAVAFLIILILAVLAVVLHFYMQRKQAAYQLTVDTNALQNVSEGEANYRKIEVDGKVYRYNTGITNILYMGVDTETDPEDEVTENAAGQADSIMLLSIDRKTQDMHLIVIPRDTMTKIRMYDNAGNYLGKATQHLSLAYAYGDGGEQSCQLEAEAVSQLLCDIPINRYIATNISSMGDINSLVGGVTVTVPNDDLEYLGTQYKEGSKLTLTDRNIETFLRYRDISKNFTNKGRMERQKAFAAAFFKKLADYASSDLDGLMNDLENLEGDAVNNLRTVEVEQILSMLDEDSLDEDHISILEGEDQQGDLHDEFYADEEKIMQLILDIYYVEVS